MHDVTREVRNRHSLVNYIQSATIKHHIRRAVAKAAAENLTQFAEVNSDSSINAAAATIVDAESDTAAADSSAPPIKR